MASTAEQIADEGSFQPVDDGLTSNDPLEFPGYAETLDKARSASSVDESVVAGPATIGGTDVELALFDFSFLGGSMGEVAGERLARAMERAAERGAPFVLRTATGGARMQEGMRSLIQMAKVVVARRRLSEAHSPFVAVLGHPTTGGVLASIAGLADLTVAESDATIGFAGPRVVERFTGSPVGTSSHTSTTAFTHGLIDELVPASDVRTYLVEALKVLAPDAPEPVSGPSREVETEGIDAWAAVEKARSSARPDGDEVLRALSDTIVELRGDRHGSDDPALSAGILRLSGRRALVLALNREHAPGPGVYRKGRRCLGLAQRLAIPVVTLVDTKGADPSSESENAGIAWEIATTFDWFLGTPLPTVSVVLGEGGSGGALAFASTDVLLAYEGSIFSVIAPEGAAEILWRDGGRAAEAARVLKLTAADLSRLGIADALIPEPIDADALAAALAYHLDRLREHDPSDLRARRLERWRKGSSKK